MVFLTVPGSVPVSKWPKWVHLPHYGGRRRRKNGPLTCRAFDRRPILDLPEKPEEGRHGFEGSGMVPGVLTWEKNGPEWPNGLSEWPPETATWRGATGRST